MGRALRCPIWVVYARSDSNKLMMVKSLIDADAHLSGGITWRIYQTINQKPHRHRRL